MSKKYKAVVWDLDGTLLNTLTDLAGSVNAALTAENLPPRTLTEVRRFVGNGIPNLITRAVPAGTDKETEAAVLSAFTAHYKIHMNDHTAPYPGIPEMLCTLRAAGVKMAVVSNTADYATAELVKLHFPEGIGAAVNVSRRTIIVTGATEEIASISFSCSLLYRRFL